MLSKESCLAALEAKDLTRQKHQLFPTRAPLSLDKVFPGLGPATLEELRLKKEDIGLVNLLITRDFPSPTNERVRYEGADISFLEAIKMKARLATTKWPEKKATVSSSSLQPDNEFKW